MKSAVVLLSGGIDSTTTLAIAIAEGHEAYALSFDYGQRHQIETEAARRIADSLGAKEHRVAKIDLRIFGGSALTDDIDVPKQRSEREIEHGIPVTYVRHATQRSASINSRKVRSTPASNQSMEPTASRRTIQLYMSSTRPSAAKRALARGSSSWFR